MSLFIQILFRILLFWSLPHLDPDHHRLLPDEGSMYLTAPDFSSLVSLSLLHIAASRSDWLETQVRSKPRSVPWEQNAKLPTVPKRPNSVWPRPIWPHLLPPALLFNQPRFQTLQGITLLRKALESILLSEHFIINHRINFFHITDFFFFLSFDHLQAGERGHELAVSEAFLGRHDSPHTSSSHFQFRENRTCAKQKSDKKCKIWKKYFFL